MGMFEKLRQVLGVAQDMIQLKGGTYVDVFAVVFIIRLLAPLKGFPQMNAAEAGMWAATIASFAYTNKG